MENEQQCSVNGIGTVEMKFIDGARIALREVRHVPMLKRNLISLGMLANDGYSPLKNIIEPHFLYHGYEFSGIEIW